jgi:acyl carrier protein
MEQTQIIEKLTSIFREVFSDSSIVLNETMTTDDVENWNSLTHMMMILKVEEALNVKFKLKELNKMKKVGDLITIICSKSE